MNFVPGGGIDEASQTVLEYLVGSDNPGLFSIQPQISPDGKLTYTPAPMTVGMARVTVQVRDSGGLDNGGNDLSDPQAFVIDVRDNMHPTAAISTLESSPTRRRSFNLTVNFGESVIGFDASDLETAGVLVGSPIDEGNGRFLVPITVADDGEFSFLIDAGKVTDLSGNTNLAGIPLQLVVDATAPIPNITSSEPNPTTNASFEISVNFGEVVTGFELSDVAAQGGIARNLIDKGMGRFQITMDSQANTSLQVAIGAGAAHDLADNPSAFSGIFSIKIQGTTARDYGDAPAASQSGFAADYPTRTADQGASHVIGNLFLGEAPTADTDGIPSTFADADVDDGLSFLVAAVASPQHATSTSVIVHSSRSGKLDGWIDFNQDGDWNDVGEQIFVSVNVVDGVNFVPLVVPASASTGATYARFRVSSLGGLMPTGPASDGEVEDYLVTLLDPASSPNLLVTPHPLTQLQVILSESEIQILAGTNILSRNHRSDVRSISIVNSDREPVLAVSSMLPPSIITLGAQEDHTLTLFTATVLDLSTLAANDLYGITRIELSDGPQSLKLDRQRIAEMTDGRPLTISYDTQDSIQPGTGWQQNGVFLDQAGMLIRRIDHGDVIVHLSGPDTYTNPIDPYDVNLSGDVTASDPLAVINELSRRLFSDATGLIRDPSKVNLSQYRFYDTNRDLRITALDALRGINELARRANASGEFISYSDSRQPGPLESDPSILLAAIDLDPRPRLSTREKLSSFAQSATSRIRPHDANRDPDLIRPPADESQSLAAELVDVVIANF